MLIVSGDLTKIQKVKNSLSREFEMRDLGKASKILGMDIIGDRKKGTLILSQENYIAKVLKSFGNDDSNPVKTSLSTQFKLKSLTKTEALHEATRMEKIPYASVVGSHMYAMIGSIQDLTHVVGVMIEGLRLSCEWIIGGQ